MSELYADHLDDPEAVMFYALALLASADPRDKTYAHQYKAAALLNWMPETQPRHPGVLHYLMHAYDAPALAHLGLDAAMVYAEAAPDSAHAQHMPSHIFTRLGLWDRSLAGLPLIRGDFPWDAFGCTPTGDAVSAAAYRSTAMEQTRAGNRAHIGRAAR